MAIRRVNGRYQVEFQAKGQRIFRRLPAQATKEQAQQLETKLRRDIFDRVSLGVVPEITIAEAIALWLTNVVPHNKDRRKPPALALRLAPFVRNRPLREVGEVAQEWVGRNTNAAINGRMNAGIVLSAATINRHLGVLKAAAHYAHSQGLVPDNLSSRVKFLPEHNKREVYLTAKQVQALSKLAPSTPSSAAIMIAAYSGLRCSELLNLPGMTGQRDTLLVPTSKNGKPRLVPIAGPARPYLSALPLAISERQLRKDFTVARERAGLPHVHFHDLRHSFASLLINKGVDLYPVGALLGHSSVQSTSRYAHLKQETLAKAVGRLK